MTPLAPHRRRRRTNVTVKLRLRSTEVLVTAMQHQGIGVRALAGSVGVVPSFITQLRKGHRPGCTPEVAQRIAENLQVGVDFLFVAQLSTSGGQASTTQAQRGAA